MISWMIAIVAVGNYFLVSIVRGIGRWQSINRYQYDYFDARPLSLVGQLIHCYQLEVFRVPTILLTLVLVAFELSVLYWLFNG